MPNNHGPSDSGAAYLRQQGLGCTSASGAAALAVVHDVHQHLQSPRLLAISRISYTRSRKPT